MEKRFVSQGEPGPPRIVEIQEKYSAVEGQSACCYMFIEGNPAPTFQFTKVRLLLQRRRSMNFQFQGFIS